MTVPVVLSASSVNTHQKCPQRWYYEYVLLLEAPPTPQQALGIAVHEAIEAGMHYKAGQAGEDPELRMYQDWYMESWDALSATMSGTEAERLTCQLDGLRLIALFAYNIGPNIGPDWIERPIQFAINGIPYSGVIDLVDDRGRIRDWKTTQRRPRPGSYLINMVGYALGYRHLTGRVESEVVLDYLVRTKTAQYVPIASGGPISDVAIGQFADQVTEVADMIAQDRYPARGINNGACRFCPFTDRCPAFAARMV